LDDLTEIHSGEWQGLHKDEIKRKWPEIWGRWRNDPSAVTIPDGESLEVVTERAIRAITHIVDTQKDKLSLIVTHEVIIKVLVAHVLQASNNIYRRFRINHNSISFLTISWLQ
jgi:broad specificity phosphatase PhoE